MGLGPSGFGPPPFPSLATFASASGMTTGELRLVFQTSGISLMYSSGKSSYQVNSAQSAVQS